NIDRHISAISAALRARSPIVSRLGASDIEPSVGTTPQGVLSPVTPQQCAGIRTEPPVSEPSAAKQQPDATNIADPVDDPPGIASKDHGLRAPRLVMPAGSYASSVMVAVPMRQAPALSRRPMIDARGSAWACGEEHPHDGA